MPWVKPLTIIRSNGSKCLGEPPDTVDQLIAVLGEQPCLGTWCPGRTGGKGEGRGDGRREGQVGEKATVILKSGKSLSFIYLYYIYINIINK